MNNNKITGKATIIDTYNFNEEDYREEFIEWATGANDYIINNDVAYKGYDEENDIYYGEVNTLTNYAHEMLDWDKDDFFGGIMRNGNFPVVVTGCLGLWDGHHTIQATLFDSLNNAINQCLEGAWDFSVKVEDEVMYVNAYHHDGCNSFEIRKITDGMYDDIMYNDYDNDCILDMLGKNKIFFNWEELYPMGI